MIVLRRKVNKKGRLGMLGVGRVAILNKMDPPKMSGSGKPHLERDI